MAAESSAFRDLAVSLSLANLCYIRVWTELLTYTRRDTYIMRRPPGPDDLVAAIVNVLLAGLAFFAIARWLRTIRNSRVQTAARWIFLVFLLLPLNSIRAILANEFTYLKSPIFELIGVKGVVLLGAVLAALAIFVLLRWSRQIAHGIAVLLLIVSPLVVMTFAQALWHIARHDPSRFVDKPHAPLLAGARPSPRVLWVIFDEWDERLTFRDRSPDLRLPDIDRFRAEGLYADNAYSPGPETLYSMPALITGKMVKDVDNDQGTAELGLIYPDRNKPVPWSKEPNIFSAARQAGFNTALVGWYHPYCRVINNDLSGCWWREMGYQHNSNGRRLLEIIPNQARSLFETSLLSVFGQSLTTIQQKTTYEEILRQSEAVIARPEYGLVLLHFPVPHAPHAYNRRTGRFDLKNSPIQGYIDSLVLTDITLADLRRTLERAGLWDKTTVLLSSDHSYRAAPALDGKKDHRIPFLMKFAGHAEPVSFSEPFNTVLTHDLLLGVLRGEISTPAQAASWLDRRRTIGDSPYNNN